MNATTSLTDRYVWAAGRSVPEAQRDELERELRERIGDATDALVDEGQAPADAEHAALTALGDPAALAADYIGRPLQLIGPRYFLVWWRLLKFLLALVLPIAVAGITLGQLLSGVEVGEVIGSAVSGALSVGVHLCFWTTLVFAILERVPAAPGQRGIDLEWKPEMLPQIADDGRTNRLVDLVSSLVLLGIFGVLLVVQQFGLPWVDALSSMPLLDPALWSFWLPYFLVLIVLEAAFAIAVYVRGWTWGLAGINLVLGAAWVVPGLWLWATGQLFNPAALEAVGWPWGEAGAVIAPIVVVVVIAAAAWDVVDGFIKAARSQQRITAV
ncbi:permease prefix domain 1-containing protein [Agromyces endophyticus]|uniref:permease prefix domain 1-containing protein n=1 Tax=Agromyces sp. H17E-10 TaxID=2932244 RepID=UPI001FD4671A|nr:permease prefix domain 1-containing protein [Agromyces sp. H17E-10]UOQ89924.1 permease prefix domain 1-containing protein [Agromyces sp. H17E-10]